MASLTSPNCSSSMTAVCPEVSKKSCYNAPYNNAGVGASVGAGVGAGAGANCVRRLDFGNNNVLSGKEDGNMISIGPHPPLSPSMRSDQTPPQSPRIPVCPGAPKKR